MRTLIAIPCMDKIDTSFAQSLMYMRRDPEDGLMFSVSSLIYDARNKLGKAAADAGAEFILWLDSDMVFEPDLLERLMESLGDKDFVTGLYFRRRPPYEPVLFEKAGYHSGEGNEVIPDADTYLNYPKDTTFEVEGCGFGAVLMRTSLFVEVEKQFGVPFAPMLGFGEDISFCIKARQMGYKLYCDSRIKVGHTAHSVVNETTFEVWRDRDVKQS